MRNNMKIDLTPLLDVMMIIIFAVLICISTASLLTFISFSISYLLLKVGLALKSQYLKVIYLSFGAFCYY